MMKIYGSATSPYVRKVRVLIAEKQIACTFVAEDPWQSRAELHALNPIGKVPVLEISGSRPLMDSLLIMEYLDAHSGGGRLLPAEGPRRWEILRWHALGHGLIDATVVRLLETRRPEAFQMPERMRREEARFARIVAAIETEMAAGPWITGDAPSIADITVGVALSYADFRYPHDWRSTAPRLARWAETMAARPAFATTLPPGFTPPG